MPQGKAIPKGLPSKDAAMTVKGFPGYEQSEVYRFQTIKGACAKNDYDCRPENVLRKTVRSEVSFPPENKNAARKGDTIVVEYDLYVPKNPDLDLFTATDDRYNFGQLQGHGDKGDVPIAVAIARMMRA